jgi:hypothetical protein
MFNWVIPIHQHMSLGLGMTFSESGEVSILVYLLNVCILYVSWMMSGCVKVGQGKVVVFLSATVVTRRSTDQWWR